MKLKPREKAGRVLRLAALQALIVAAPMASAAAPELRSEGGLLVLPNVKVEMAQQPVDGKPMLGRQNGVKAYKEHDTGKLRKITPEEQQEEAQSAPLDNNAAAARVTTSASGGKSALLDESFMSYAVVRKGADGKLDTQCVTGETQARAALKGQAVAKEHRHAH